MKHRRPSQRSQSFNSPTIQPLEERRMMSAATIGIYAAQNASETRPTTSGRGVFEFKRAVGSVAHSITLAYTVSSTSTTSSSDYASLSGLVTIPARQRTVAINVIPVDDSLVEGTEKLDLTLVSRTGYTNVHSRAEITIADNDTNVTPSGNWFGDNRTSRTSLTYNPGSTARTANQPFDYNLNFTNVLSGLSKSGSLIDNSIKVVETNAAGTAVVNSNVPYQFDHGSTFNASSNASGDLVVEATGATAANTTRYYQVYFDTTGSYTAPSFTSLVTTANNVTDLSGDASSIKITTGTATYYYQKDTGGFSSIIDANGKDWVSWNSTPGSAGEYRGVPNLGGSGFHPGRTPEAADGVSGDAMNTTIVSSGPLKTVVDSKTTVTGNEVKWEFYPTYARMSVISMNQNYYFLYEATPGGASSTNGATITNHDVLVSSSGSAPLNSSNAAVTATSTATDESSDFNLNNNGQEWAYMQNTDANSGNGRYFYMVHDNADNLADSYFDLDGNMTVLGFGRQNTSGNNRNLLLSGQNSFTIGLADGGSNFAAAAATINSTYQASTLTAGAAATKPA